MASNEFSRPKDRKNRSAKPYDRPKGIITRVTSSVTGLLSGTWLSNWLRSDDSDACEEQYPLQEPATAYDPFAFSGEQQLRHLYPEEGENTPRLSSNSGVNVGASTSGLQDSYSGATERNKSTRLYPPFSFSTETSSLPVLEGSPAVVPGTSSLYVPKLFSRHTVVGSAEEASQHSCDTDIDQSVISRQGDSDYQQEILQLDDVSLQNLRETLSHNPLDSGAEVSVASAVPNVKKRTRDSESDTQLSKDQEGSRTLFEDDGSQASQPQPSALSCKRPRFSISAYGSPVNLDTSSDILPFKSSPFYPGKTMYGGASYYRKPKFYQRSKNVPVLKNKVATYSEDGGLSQAAKRILHCLENMTTSISDAKRIPAPIQRGSFLDASPSYTAAFHKHRPLLRSSVPPAAKLLTPVRVQRKEGLLNPDSSKANVVPKTVSYEVERQGEKLLAVAVPASSSESSMTCTSQSSGSLSGAPVCSAQTLTVLTTKDSSENYVSSPTHDTSTNNTSSGQDGSNPVKTPPTEKSSFAQLPVPAVVTAAQSTSRHCSLSKGGGKMRARVSDTGRGTDASQPEGVQPPILPTDCRLSLSTLPSIVFSKEGDSTKSVDNGAQCTYMFAFSDPVILQTSSVSSSDISNSSFVFRNPYSVCVSENCSSDKVESGMFGYSSPSNFVPKLKSPIHGTSKSALVSGSVADFLKGEKDQTNGADVSRTVSEHKNSSDAVNWGNKFKPEPGSWECETCLVRNSPGSLACAACDTAKPTSGKIVTTLQVTVNNNNINTTVACKSDSSEFGSQFRKSRDQWECGMCMIRNKNELAVCAACKAFKPKEVSDALSDQSGNSFVSPSVTSSQEHDRTAEKTSATCETVSSSNAAFCSVNGLPCMPSVFSAESGFGSKFMKKEGEWECDTCLVRNKKEAVKCVSCETPKPGLAAVSVAKTGNFHFGVKNVSEDNQPFKFGVTDDVSSKSAGSSVGNQNSEVSLPFVPKGNFSSEGVSSESSTVFKFGMSDCVSSSVPVTTSCGSCPVVSAVSSSVPTTAGFKFAFTGGSEASPQFKFGFASPVSAKAPATSVSDIYASASNKVTSESYGVKASEDAVVGSSPKSDCGKKDNSALTPPYPNHTASSSDSSKLLLSIGTGFQLPDGLKSVVPKVSSNASKGTSAVSEGGEKSTAVLPAAHSTSGLGVSGKMPSGPCKDVNTETVIANCTSGQQPKSFFALDSTKGNSIQNSVFKFGGNLQKSNTSDLVIRFGENSQNCISAPASIFSTGDTAQKPGFAIDKTEVNSKSVNNGFNSVFSFSSNVKTDAKTLFGSPFVSFESDKSRMETPGQLEKVAFTPNSASSPFGSLFGAKDDRLQTESLNSLQSSVSPFAFGQNPAKRTSTGFNFGQASKGIKPFSTGPSTPGAFQLGQISSSGSAETSSMVPAFTIGAGPEATKRSSSTPGRTIKKAVRRTLPK